MLIVRTVRRSFLLHCPIDHRADEYGGAPANSVPARAPPGGFALACGSCRDTRCGRDRVARTVATFAHEFTLIPKRRVSTSADFDAAALNDVLLSIYPPMRSQPTHAMCVTFSLDLPLFQAA